jgi:hypothetical protein
MKSMLQPALRGCTLWKKARLAAQPRLFQHWDWESKQQKKGSVVPTKESCVRFALLDGVRHFGSGRFAHARNRPLIKSVVLWPGTLVIVATLCNHYVYVSKPTGPPWPGTRSCGPVTSEDKRLRGAAAELFDHKGLTSTTKLLAAPCQHGQRDAKTAANMATGKAQTRENSRTRPRWPRCVNPQQPGSANLHCLAGGRTVGR